MLLQLLAFILDVGHAFFGFTESLIYTYKIWIVDLTFFSHVFIVKYKRRKRGREARSIGVKGV